MIIEYQVPRLGIVRANLYSQAEIAFQILERSGHIDRLRSIDHLGVIRSVNEGAHHTRWEYVVTQLYLVNMLNKDPALKGAGLFKRYHALYLSSGIFRQN